MNARSPAAFFASATIHALFAALFIFTSYAFKEEAIKSSQVFDVVAGVGDNYEALEAPALGDPKSMKIDMPELPPLASVAPEMLVSPAPEPTPEPVVAPEPVVTPAPPEPSPVKPAPTPKPEPKTEPKNPVKTPPKAEPKAPNFVSTMKTTQRRIAKKQKAAADKRRREAEAAAKRLSYQEFLAQQKKNAAGAKAGSSTSKATRIDAKGIAEGVVGGSTANTKSGAGGKALTREEQDMLDTYLAMVRHRLKEAHEQVKPDTSDNLSAVVEFYLGADGSLSRVTIVKSSGNTEFDQSVLAAFQTVRSIGRSRPDGRSDLRRLTFRMQEADD